MTFSACLVEKQIRREEGNGKDKRVRENEIKRGLILILLFGLTWNHLQNIITKVFVQQQLLQEATRQSEPL